MLFSRVVFYDLFIIQTLIFPFCFFQVGSWEGSEDTPMFWQWCQLPLSIGECFLAKDHHGCWPEVDCCGVTFFVIATTTGCYNDKATFVSTLFRNDVSGNKYQFPVSLETVSRTFCYLSKIET